jgi:hypothetical protein
MSFKGAEKRPDLLIRGFGPGVGKHYSVHYAALALVVVHHHFDAEPPRVGFRHHAAGPGLTSMGTVSSQEMSIRDGFYCRTLTITSGC